MRKTNKLELLFLFIVFIVLFVIITKTPYIYKYKNTGKLIINEVMSSNKNTIVDSYGKKSDYIEIYNGYDYDINLKNYYLSDDNFNLKKWSFPDVTIKAGAYLLVFADGKNTYQDNEIHTNFKISKKGEVLTLSDKKANPLSRIYFTETKSDTSYGYNGKSYVYYYVATPGEANSSNYTTEAIKDLELDSKLKITEYSKGSNAQIEIYNGEDHAINLSNYYLSNERANPYKYQFPDVTIEKESYLVIYADGTDKLVDNKLHINFILDPHDNILIFSDNTKNTIEKVYLKEFTGNYSCGYYQNSWHLYKEKSFGKENNANYLEENITLNTLRINEVSTSKIELKNLTDSDLKLNDYTLGDKSGKLVNLSGTIKAGGYRAYNTQDIGISIGNGAEILYLYQNGLNIDTYEVGKLTASNSSGLNNDGKRVYYTKVTMGSNNANDYYLGYAANPIFSQDGGYLEKDSKVTLTAPDNSTIYYTLDGSFPTNRSKKYEGELTISKTTTIKAIAYKDGYLSSDIVSRTFIVGRHHNLPVVSISSDYSSFYGWNGIIDAYYQNSTRKISFEYYEKDGTLGTSFLADTKLSGMDSRKQAQKSMSIYLRKAYGTKEVTYPFFDSFENTTYSSMLFRNAGEDPKNIRIMDAVLTRTLKGQMDIDMQDYKPVVIYINGAYQGIYNMREKLNGDYLETKFGVDKDNVDLIKYTTAVKGSTTNYNNLVNYIYSHDMANQNNYEYIKSQIDVEELCNYWITQSYYGNTDLGNIRYWKAKNGKWRWMIYDLDWSLWSSTTRFGYPVVGYDSPGVTYLSSSIDISRRLYRNSEYKDLYLKTLAYHLENTFYPDRMNAIVDELAKEIETEMPYHIERWKSGYPGLTSMDRWHSNLNSFKQMIKDRYYYVKNNLRYQLNLSNDEYNKYFKELK